MRNQLEELEDYLANVINVYDEVDDIGEALEIQSEVNRMARDIESISYIWESIDADRETLFVNKCIYLHAIVLQEIEKYY